MHASVLKEVKLFSLRGYLKGEGFIRAVERIQIIFSFFTHTALEMKFGIKSESESLNFVLVCFEVII